MILVYFFAERLSVMLSDDPLEWLESNAEDGEGSIIIDASDFFGTYLIIKR